MKDHYHIDLEKFSLGKFKFNLQTKDLIPSRVSLKDDLERRFSILENQGVTNMQELVDALKTKQKLELFSESTGLDKQYLTLLKREAKSYQPNPIRLDKFSGIEAAYLQSLEVVGIKNSRQLLVETSSRVQKEQLVKATNVPIEKMSEIIGLSDLARAYGVGPVFARMIYDLGICSIRDFVRLTAEEVVRLYEEETQKKADFGLNEIQFSLELAKELAQINESAS